MCVVAGVRRLNFRYLIHMNDGREKNNFSTPFSCIWPIDLTLFHFTDDYSEAILFVQHTLKHTIRELLAASRLL